MNLNSRVFSHYLRAFDNWWREGLHKSGDFASAPLRVLVHEHGYLNISQGLNYTCELKMQQTLFGNRHVLRDGWVNRTSSPEPNAH